MPRGARLEAEWRTRLDAYASAHPELAAELARRLAGELPATWEHALPAFGPDAGAMATRAASAMLSGSAGTGSRSSSVSSTAVRRFLTMSIAALVGAVGIATIMTMAVRERTAEIGLLRALGAHQKQVLALFLGEAMVLAAIGGLVGLAIGILGAQLLHLAFPAMPVHTPLNYVVFSEVLAAGIGLLAGVLPARHAAAMDPVTALRAE